MTIKVYIDHLLRIPTKPLPEGALQSIVDALSIPNIAKEEARQNHQWGWEKMPDTVDMWALQEIAGETFLMAPRGFFDDLKVGLTVMGVEVQLADWRTRAPIPMGLANHIDAYGWQDKAIRQILDKTQGIYKAPAGSGKTVAILEAIRQSGQKALIIINTKDILWQWQDRITKFLGPDVPIGQIGDNQFDVVNGITVATAQTLHSRFRELEATEFFSQFGFVCLDECHHATADTYNRLVNRFTAKYRVGVSATPDKTGDFRLAQLVLGPIIHETRPSEVTNLITPALMKVPTNFTFAFRGNRGRFQRSNYGEMIQALITNPERNELIADVIKKEEGHFSLAISKRLEHLDILEQMMYDRGYDGHILKLTGNESRKERQRVVDVANSEPCLILSTLADEALDIPRLDRGFLVFPQKNPGLVTQQIGRFERKHPDKKDAIIYDFTDDKVGPLAKQWRIRRLEVYIPRGYEICWRQNGQENH